MFKKLKGMFGGGTKVETTIHTPSAQPGGVIEGVVDIVGGEQEQQIKYLALGLVATVEVETEDSEYNSEQKFAELRVTGEFVLQPGAQHQVPFQFPLPVETPFNLLGNQELHGVKLGLRTELEIAKSLDKGDRDSIRVAPLPAQHRILAAFDRIGFHLKGADLERGRIPGASLPFYQELEFAPGPEFAGRVNELEVTFVAGPQTMDVLLEVDNRGGLISQGHDAVQRFTVDYASVDHHDWESVLRDQLHHLAQRRGLFF